MASNYDNSAPFYDGLSRIIFGRALVKAQIYLVQYLPPHTKILIAGGGTGWILEEIAKIHAAGLEITYVEISAKMTGRSQKRNVANNQVAFINDAIEHVLLDGNYDVVITPFLFDNFKQDNLAPIFNHLHESLKSGGLWLCADFQVTGPIWQRVLLKSMYLFFKVLCGIETTTMPDIEAQFSKHQYKKNSAETFFAEFIISTQYQKP